MGEMAQAMRASLPVVPKTSYRWILNATLFSLALAVLLFFLVFLFNVIPNVMRSSETGWTDFTAAQWANMKFWYLILLGGGVALIFLSFYLRRSKDEL
jgi:hypothetical protein